MQFYAPVSDYISEWDKSNISDTGVILASIIGWVSKIDFKNSNTNFEDICPQASVPDLIFQEDLVFHRRSGKWRGDQTGVRKGICWLLRT